MSETTRPLYAIARDIRNDWPRINYAAVPYLDAMADLDTMAGKHWADSASDIVRYFLSNASTWRGPVAKRIKTELKGMLP
tara:strand:+ start:757 stop:996 length:240 start_codon:yes stop_codon:yes gene_type:complete